MKILLTVTALLEAGAGLALLGIPSAMATLLLGAPLETPASLTVARVGGGGLLALAIACWMARDDSQSRAARGLFVAMLVYNLAAVATLAFASIALKLRGAGLWPAVILHAIMGVWCVACLVKKAVR